MIPSQYGSIPKVFWLGDLLHSIPSSIVNEVPESETIDRDLLGSPRLSGKSDHSGEPNKDMIFSRL